VVDRLLQAALDRRDDEQMDREGERFEHKPHCEICGTPILKDELLRLKKAHGRTDRCFDCLDVVTVQRSEGVVAENADLPAVQQSDGAQQQVAPQAPPAAQQGNGAMHAAQNEAPAPRRRRRKRKARRQAAAPQAAPAPRQPRRRRQAGASARRRAAARGDPDFDAVIGKLLAKAAEMSAGAKALREKAGVLRKMSRMLR
jgi:hypothetical protein